MMKSKPRLLAKSQSQILRVSRPASSYSRGLNTSIEGWSSVLGKSSAPQSRLSPAKERQQSMLSKSIKVDEKTLKRNLRAGFSGLSQSQLDLRNVERRTDGFLPSFDQLVSQPNKSAAEPRPSTQMKSFDINCTRLSLKDKGAARGETAANPLKPTQEKTSLVSVLSKHYIFGTLSKTQIQKLASSMKQYKLPPNDIVFKWSPANFFIVATGSMEVVLNGRYVKTLNPGDCFGEMELINDAPRIAIVRTLEPCIFWGIDKPSFRPFLSAIKAQDVNEKKDFLSTVEIFSELTNSQKENLATVLIPHEFAPGYKILKEGDIGDLMYIIREGTVVCYMKSVEIRRLSKGEFFGEQALLYGGTRAATVIAEGSVRCVSISKSNFVEILNNYFPMIYLYTILNTFKKSPYLCHLPQSFVPKLIAFMTFKTYNSSKIAIPKGTPKGLNLWIVLKGALVSSQSQRIVEFPSCFGDTLLPFPPSGAYEEDYRVLGSSAVLAKLSRSDFHLCLGAAINQVNFDYDTFSTLKTVQLLDGLDVYALRELVVMAELLTYRNGEEIVEQNTAGDSLFIIKSGHVFVKKDGVRQKTITKFDYFGERSILFDEVNPTTMIAMINVSCWAIKKPDFLKIMTPAIRQRLVARIDRQEEEKININALIYVKTLGSGQYGQVHLVAHRDRPSLYALKTIAKLKDDRSKEDRVKEEKVDSPHSEEMKSKDPRLEAKLEEAKRREAIKIELRKKAFIEKEMLSQIEHPFLIKLISASEDDDRFYFLLEHANGFTLQDLRTKLGVISDEMAKFYAAAGILMLEYLHDRGIMHRDLELTNIIVAEDGYPKLIDFCHSKYVLTRTFSIISPPHTLAPEVIRRRGYSHSADFFSLGVMLYKFICGRYPFADEEVDVTRIYSQILKHNLVFPEDTEMSVGAKGFIERLLTADPRARVEGGADALRAHTWFRGLEWVRDR